MSQEPDNAGSFELDEVIDGQRVRIVVPRALTDDELGGTPDDAARRAWIEAQLPEILGAATARLQGGWVKEPWGRLLIEEMN